MPPYHGIARNCLPGCGVTARERGKSVLGECKRLFYDLRHLDWLLDIDQRECCATPTPTVSCNKSNAI